MSRREHPCVNEKRQQCGSDQTGNSRPDDSIVRHETGRRYVRRWSYPLHTVKRPHGRGDMILVFVFPPLANMKLIMSI
jgi:hypothetical protein